jgi:mono/diheme cytochrome c family protein
MKTHILKACLAALLVAGLASTAYAQTKGQFDLGKCEFDSNCAVCHGLQGKGDGAYGEFLKRPATDLSMLKKNNGGVFPFERVYASIDGRDMIKSHGDRDMPVWGRDYSTQTVRAAEYYVDVPYDMDMYVRSRILALIDYVNRLQAK